MYGLFTYDFSLKEIQAFDTNTTFLTCHGACYMLQDTVTTLFQLNYIYI